MRKIMACIVAGTMAAAPARADWLERAWSEESVMANGDPSVTLGRDGVLLVLPEATLRDAYAAGLDTKAAVRLFLGRWAQRCSDVVDLDQVQSKLKVRLFLQNPVAIEDASEAVQGEILDTLQALKKSAVKGGKKVAKTRVLPRVDNVFVASEDHVDFVIDYFPQGRARCVQPGLDDEGS
jgi:hypothetical protein